MYFHVAGLRSTVESKKGAFWCRGWIITVCSVLLITLLLPSDPCRGDGTNLNISSTFNKPFSGAAARFSSNIFLGGDSSVSHWGVALAQQQSAATAAVIAFCRAIRTLPSAVVFFALPFICLRTEWEACAAKCFFFFFFCIRTRCVTKMWEWNGALSQHHWDYTYCMLLFPSSRVQSFFLTSLVGFSLPVFVFP